MTRSRVGFSPPILLRLLCLTIAACCALAPLVARAQATAGLRCQVREGLIEFLRSRYPESLPRVRMAWQRLEEIPEAVAPHPATAEGKEHERGPSAPGLESEKPDGTAR
jgi:hypothetical protein